MLPVSLRIKAVLGVLRESLGVPRVEYYISHYSTRRSLSVTRRPLRSFSDRRKFQIDPLSKPFIFNP